MKDLIITVKRQKTEWLTLLACFIIANLLNVYAIISYKTCLSELFWSLGYVVVCTIALYVLWTVLRLAFYGIRKLFNR
ncbi:MAG: hypothetical protein LBC40_07265 [Dysgonamonadaceae bacterium]|jgi:uncharacterized integral membrane protein|nr:hypothetical protein [Dysgonamonadaceae bacterium]